MVNSLPEILAMVYEQKIQDLYITLDILPGDPPVEKYNGVVISVQDSQTIVKIFQALPNNHSVKSLSLHNVILNAHYLEHLRAALAAPMLQYLTLSNTLSNPGTTSIQTLLDALPGNKSLTSLRLTNIKLRAVEVKKLALILNMTNISSVDISDNNLSSDAVEYFIDALKYSKQVQNVNISFNKLPMEVITDLMYKIPPSVVCFMFNGCLERHKLSRKINPEQKQKFIDSFIDNQHLVEPPFKELHQTDVGIVATEMVQRNSKFGGSFSCFRNKENSLLKYVNMFERYAQCEAGKHTIAKFRFI
jgi:hypothetical protein